LNGDTNAKYLQDNGVRIWNEWADEDGNLGHIYGFQWRSWPDYNGGSVDQITEAVNTIKNNPDSRRIIVSAWNVADLPNMNLPPCHAFFPILCSQWEVIVPVVPTQCRFIFGRSVQHRFLRTAYHDDGTGLRSRAGDFVHTFGDLHIYTNHIEQVKLQLSRDRIRFHK
jgi:thymidylate synthase